MKKFYGFILGMTLFTGLLFLSCSNGNDTPPIGAVSTPTTQTAAYTVLPTGTNGTAGTNWTYVTFGHWPQTIKAANVTVDESVTEEHGMFTYCKGSDGEWYVKAKENAFFGGVKYSDGTDGKENSKNSYRWFKVEPIKWRILTSDYNGTKKKLLLAEKILVGGQYYDFSGVPRTIDSVDVFQNNYEHSKIRAYLNGLSYQIKPKDDAVQTTDETFGGKGFLQSAFTDAEQAAIFKTTVDNSARSTNPDSDANLWNSGNNRYVCGNTQDKVFLLSEQEVTKDNYGFALYDQEGVETSRIRTISDYALATGVFYENQPGGWWWLRSPQDFAALFSHAVGCSGHANFYKVGGRVDMDNAGIVPALCVE